MSKMTESEYHALNLLSLDCSEVWWKARSDKEDGFIYTVLFADNKKKFKSALGEQVLCYNGYVRYWVWKVKLPLGNLWINSSTRGTGYNVEPNVDASYEDVCQQALEYLKGFFYTEIEDMKEQIKEWENER